jgi:hypothetical protein
MKGSFRLSDCVAEEDIVTSCTLYGLDDALELVAISVESLQEGVHLGDAGAGGLLHSTNTYKSHIIPQSNIKNDNKNGGITCFAHSFAHVVLVSPGQRPLDAVRSQTHVVRQLVGQFHPSLCTGNHRKDGEGQVTDGTDGLERRIDELKFTNKKEICSIYFLNGGILI